MDDAEAANVWPAGWRSWSDNWRRRWRGSRSSAVLKEFLGETFQGVLGRDDHSAYRRFLHDLGVALQFCWSHLIRDVKYLVPLPDAATRRFGEKLLAQIKRLFRVWHRRDPIPTERWSREADRAQQGVLQVTRRPPARSETQNIAERFRRHREHYVRFLTAPGVEPTNNAMEQRFRDAVWHRREVGAALEPLSRQHIANPQDAREPIEILPPAVVDIEIVAHKEHSPSVLHPDDSLDRAVAWYDP